MTEEVVSVIYISVENLRLGEELRPAQGHSASERQKGSLNPGLAMAFAPGQANKELEVLKARPREMRMGSQVMACEPLKSC